MRFSVTVSILLVLAVLCPGQTGEQKINSEAQLSSALCSVELDERSRADLLKNYPQLVDSRLVESINRRAVNAYYQESPERALKIYDVSIQVALKLGQLGLLGKTYYNLARTFSGLNQPEKAIESYTKSREYFEQASLKRDLIYVLADLGAIYFNKEDYQRAKEYSERSISIADSSISSDLPAGSYPDDFGRARALHTLAEIDLRNGNHEDAIEKLNRALILYQALNGQDSNYTYYLAGVYAALGKVYPEIGDYTRALLNLNKALDIANASRDQDTIANILNSIGFLYMEQEDYDQAQVNFQRSLKIYLAENNQIEAAKLHLNLGVIEQRQSHNEEALALFNLSLKEAKAAQITDAQLAANEGIGVVLSAKRDFTGALATLNQSLALAKETKDRTREIELLWRSAQSYLGMQDYARATKTAEDARLLAHTMRLPKLEYLAATTLGQSYAAQGNNDLAIQTLKEAVDQLELMRNEVAGREIELQTFLENKTASYNALVELLVTQGKPLDALLYAERAKARVLLDVLRGNRPALASVLTSIEKQKLQSLNQEISQINDRIKRQESGAVALKLLYPELDAARLKYQSFQDSLNLAHRELRIRSGQTTALTNTDIKDLNADGDNAYLEYVAAKDRVWLFVVTKNKTSGAVDVRVYAIQSKTEDLVRKVNEFHDTLADRRASYANAAHELYKLLIGPAEEQLRNVGTLCVVPDGFLWNVPFQALMTESDHFLIADHTVYYAPSLGVLREMIRKGASSKNLNSSLIAFGNPVIGKEERASADLCPLPEAEREVTSIAKSFHSAGAKVFIGREATEKTFKALAPRYSIIHLATHGIIDNRQPLYSHVILTKTEGDSENDGLLEAREIIDMNLRADLAVLSACETANGRISPGEGVIGMSWAFFVAGTHSMVASQWKVDSKSTSKLMANFYDALARRSSKQKAVAVREAALELMKDRHFVHPFYWAGFVLIGGE